METPWDVVLIDAPRGYADDLPGRAAPIYTTARMLKAVKGSPRTVSVFVHDVDREVRHAFAIHRRRALGGVGGGGRTNRAAARGVTVGRADDSGGRGWARPQCALGGCIAPSSQLERTLSDRFFPDVRKRRLSSMYGFDVVVTD